MLQGNVQQCTGSAVSNCKSYALDGSCFECLTGYYLDLATKTCIVLTTSVASCEAYSRASASASILCSRCAVGYYLAANQLTCTSQALNTIANCQSYTSSTVCSACAAGFYLGPNAATCIAVPGGFDAKCAVYSQTTGACLGCVAPNILQVTPSGATCTSTSLSNCLGYAANNVCNICNPGFYPLNGVCVAITSVIANCQLYSGPNSC